VRAGEERDARVDARRARRAGLQSSVQPENVLRVGIMWRGSHRHLQWNHLNNADVSLHDFFFGILSFEIGIFIFMFANR
jgi:hypothetical protein